jgi:cytochrome P450
MFRIANELLTETKAVAAGTGEKQGGRDLLSLLVRANMATDVPESQRMSDEDVLARTWLSCHFYASQILISPFRRGSYFHRGWTRNYEVTSLFSEVEIYLICIFSSATTWALFALTQDMRVQSKLREELLTVDTDNPTMDQLNALPYLDMVVRETLRVHAPVPSTVRVAVQDDILPLSTPVTDRRGRVHDSVM